MNMSTTMMKLALIALAMIARTNADECEVRDCCDHEIYANNTEQLLRTCDGLRSFCYGSYDSGCDDDEYYFHPKKMVSFNSNTEAELSSGGGNNSLSGGESALIAVGSILAVLIVVIVGVSSWRHHNKENTGNGELNATLMEEETPPPSRDNNRVLTVLTIMSCVVAVVALIVAIVAVSDKPVVSPTPTQSSSSSGSNLQALKDALANSAQLRTGPYKLKASSMIASHPFCHTDMNYWKACVQLQTDVENLITTIGTRQLNVTHTSSLITTGKAGVRTFVANNSKFIATSPALAVLQSKINTLHSLASTKLCQVWTAFSVSVCVTQHTSVATNTSALVAYIQPNPPSTLRTRRSFLSSTIDQLSSNWDGTVSGAESAVESGAESGAESVAWHGAVAGAIAGIAGGPAGIIAGAVGGAVNGAITGAVNGAVSGGEHYVEGAAIDDAEMKQTFDNNDDWD